MHFHTRLSVNLFIHSLLSESLSHSSICICSQSMPPPTKYLYFFELMTEKPQTSPPCAAAPGRLTEQHNIVWRDIVPTWAEALTSCLCKLSSVVFARRRILFWCLNPYWDANCFCILPPQAPSFGSAFVIGQFMWSCSVELKMCVYPGVYCFRHSSCMSRLAWRGGSSHCCVLWFSVSSRLLI